MADIRPFPGYRPRADLASRIAALPYDVYNREEAREEVKREPCSFLRVDRAETGFGEDVDIYAPCVYERARDLLREMIQKGQYIQDKSPCYYIYELTMGTHSQTGIVACASVDDYQNQVIRKHENTREEKELDRIRHVDVCDMQTGPIFLAYRSREDIDRVVNEGKKENPVYDFTAQDGVRHRVWVIAEEERIEKIRAAFAKIDSLYIADGHHRAASAVKVGLKRREAHPGYTGNEPFHYFLSVLFPHDQLQILSYNRVVKDLNGLSREEYLRQTETCFEVEYTGRTFPLPEKKGMFAMYLKDGWYRLRIRKELISKDPVGCLDVTLLQKYLLDPILGIRDPKTDQRIAFVGGIRGYKELEKRVREDCALAFALYPTSMEELFAVADAGRLMPPKSTWFEPKLRSGLFLHSISE